MPFQLRCRLEGSGTSGHVGAHFRGESSAALPAGFKPGDWQGQRASEHLGAPAPMSLPLDVAVNATLPFVGTWFLRPHAVLDGTNHWGDEVWIEAAPPASPNIVLLNASASAVAGEPLGIRFAATRSPGPRATSGPTSAGTAARRWPLESSRGTGAASAPRPTSARRSRWRSLGFSP